MSNITTQLLREELEHWWDSLSEDQKIEIFKHHNKIIIE